MSEMKKNATPLLEKEVGITKSVTKAKELEILAYVGPTIPGVASHSQLFNNGLPDGLKQAIEKEPAFKGLVVPLIKLAVAINELQMKSGVTYALYQKVINYKP